ncbi:hypothetical protein BLOT_015009 [Blomia tropicalis]|nr:hypothetical protein BLOT_015009 [Blomia tropicalis]
MFDDTHGRQHPKPLSASTLLMGGWHLKANKREKIGEKERERSQVVEANRCQSRCKNEVSN